jgi:hypothetical protein
VNFNLSIWINRPPGEVLAFLRDKDEYPQKPGSPVLALDKLTPGPVRVGTHYREVVRMLPGVRGEIRSVVTRFEPPARLEESFAGAGMAGHLAYEFVPDDGGTLLVQRERLVARGWLAPLSPFIRITLARRLRRRLAEIKAVLEAGGTVTASRSPTRSSGAARQTGVRLVVDAWPWVGTERRDG